MLRKKWSCYYSFGKMKRKKGFGWTFQDIYLYVHVYTCEYACWNIDDFRFGSILFVYILLLLWRERVKKTSEVNAVKRKTKTNNIRRTDLTQKIPPIFEYVRVFILYTYILNMTFHNVVYCPWETETFRHTIFLFIFPLFFSTLFVIIGTYTCHLYLICDLCACIWAVLLLLISLTVICPTSYSNFVRAWWCEHWT